MWSVSCQNTPRSFKVTLLKSIQVRKISKYVSEIFCENVEHET